MEAIGKADCKQPAPAPKSVDAITRAGQEYNVCIGESQEEILTPGQVAALAEMDPGFESASFLYPGDNNFEVVPVYLPAVIARRTTKVKLIERAYGVRAYLIPPEGGGRGRIILNTAWMDLIRTFQGWDKTAAQAADAIKQLYDDGKGKSKRLIAWA